MCVCVVYDVSQDRSFPSSAHPYEDTPACITRARDPVLPSSSALHGRMKQTGGGSSHGQALRCKNTPMPHLCTVQMCLHLQPLWTMCASAVLRHDRTRSAATHALAAFESGQPLCGAPSWFLSGVHPATARAAPLATAPGGSPGSASMDTARGRRAKCHRC